MDPVEEFYQNSVEAVARVPEQEVSLKVWLQAALAKGFIIAAASQFEARIITQLTSAYQRHLPPPLAQFAVNKSLVRQYHTLFNWAVPNANQFFGLFGESFAATLKAQIARDRDLQDAVRHFLNLGQQRNLLVHGDFSAYSLEVTLEEAHGRYQQAVLFLDVVQSAVAGQS